MADILIRGMEMPKGNNAISIIIFSNGKVSLVHDKKYAEYAEAVPLPEGHGKLGDLDALMNNIGDVPYKGSVRRVLMSAPTIVPAEGDNN